MNLIEYWNRNRDMKKKKQIKRGFKANEVCSFLFFFIYFIISYDIEFRFLLFWLLFITCCSVSSYFLIVAYLYFQKQILLLPIVYLLCNSNNFNFLFPYIITNPQKHP